MDRKELAMVPGGKGSMLLVFGDPPTFLGRSCIDSLSEKKEVGCGNWYVDNTN